MSYKMPAVHVGQLVLWHPDANAPADYCPALVTQTWHDSVSLSVIRRDSRFLEPLDGVRHLTDPSARRLELRDLGAWSHTPETLALQELVGEPEEAEAVTA